MFILIVSIIFLLIWIHEKCSFKNSMTYDDIVIGLIDIFG